MFTLIVSLLCKHLATFCLLSFLQIEEVSSNDLIQLIAETDTEVHLQQAQTKGAMRRVHERMDRLVSGSKGELCTTQSNLQALCDITVEKGFV